MCIELRSALRPTLRNKGGSKEWIHNMTERERVILLQSQCDERAFNALYKQWCGKLFNFVMKLSGGDSSLAEEIVQDVFVTVWERRATLDENKSFGNYICTIAKSRLLNTYKHRIVESLYTRLVRETVSEATDTTRNEIDTDFLSEFISTIIDELPETRRRIFRMSRYECLTNKEIATRLHLSENTVESQMNKALKFIRSRIEKYYFLIVVAFLCQMGTGN